MNEKMMRVRELYVEAMLDDQRLTKFFDIESGHLLDLKIEVLTKLVNGTPPSKIPEYYSILELYPTDDQLWD